MPPVAREMLATHPCPCGLGWLHAGPSTDGTLPAEGRGASHPLAGCHCPPPVSGTRTQKPSPFPAARDVLCRQLEQRLEAPGIPVPPASRLEQDPRKAGQWGHLVTSRSRPGLATGYPPGLGAAARQGWGDAFHPCGQGEKGIKHSPLPHHAEIPQKHYPGRHRRQEITLANGA